MQNAGKFNGCQCGSSHRPSIIAETCKVIYKAKDGKQRRSFKALELPLTKCSLVPDSGEQMVRYYWHYSKAARDKRREEKRGN